MALGTLILLIILGFGILLVELFFIPGSTVFGLAGIALMIIGVALTYKDYGLFAGNVTLAASFFTTVTATLIAFKTFENSDLGLKEELDGRVNELKNLAVKVGDIGTAFGDLKPQGRAKIKGNIYNVDSTGDYIVDQDEIKIVRITENKIFVDLI